VCRLKPILARFGNKKLSEISQFDIEKFKIERLKTPVVYKTKSKPRTPASVNRELSLLSKIFTVAIRAKEATENPCRSVDRVRGEHNRTRYLGDYEEGRLLDALTGRRSHMRTIILLYLNTGVRASELLILKPEHVDLHRDIIHVTKTDKDREIPIKGTVRELLSGLVDDASRKGNEYLQTNPRTGTRYKDLRTAWFNACKDAGIENLRIHGLRYSFGTRVADAGVPLSAIKAIMGHKSAQTTERYVHATDDGLRRALEAADTNRRVAQNEPSTDVVTPIQTHL
jgi:integrase